MSDYHETWKQLMKLEEEARTTGEPAVGIITVLPPPGNPKVTILKKWLFNDDKDKGCKDKG